MNFENHDDNGADIKEAAVEEYANTNEVAKDVVAFENHSDDGVEIEENVVEDVHHEATVEEYVDAYKVAKDFENHSDNGVEIKEKEKEDDNVEDGEVAPEVTQDVMDVEEQ